MKTCLIKGPATSSMILVVQHGILMLVIYIKLVSSAIIAKYCSYDGFSAACVSSTSSGESLEGW
jgi:hypothetical protein